MGSQNDLKGDPQGDTLLCYPPDALVAEPGLLTVDECIERLLCDGEISAGNENRRAILLDGILVGYITVSDDPADLS